GGHRRRLPLGRPRESRSGRERDRRALYGGGFRLPRDAEQDRKTRRRLSAMKLALAQINARVGDVEGNLGKIRAALSRAADDGADLVVFPEQSLGGYPALDLWEEPGFVRANAQALQALAKDRRRTACLVGFVEANRGRRGKPIYN